MLIVKSKLTSLKSFKNCNIGFKLEISHYKIISHKKVLLLSLIRILIVLGHTAMILWLIWILKQHSFYKKKLVPFYFSKLLHGM